MSRILRFAMRCVIKRSGLFLTYFSSPLYLLGFPAIVVAISLAVTQTNGYGNKDVCWLDAKSGLIWAFIGPALLVILVSSYFLALP